MDGGRVSPPRERRLVFGEVADEYERFRPDYPSALVDELLAVAGLAPGDRVLEIGAGTGKATRLVGRSRAWTSPPSSRTRRWRQWRGGTRQQHRSSCPVSRIGRCLRSPSPPSWPHSRGTGSTPRSGPRKAADALRPGGWLALLWNRPDLEGSKWHDDLQPIYKRIVPGMEHTLEKTFADSRGRAVDQLARSGRFGEAVERGFPWVARYTTGEYLDLLNTNSDKRILPDAQRAALLDAIGASLDSAGGVIDHPYIAELVAAPVLGR